MYFYLHFVTAIFPEHMIFLFSFCCHQSSVPGSTNTTTTSTSPHPVGRIQISAEDPDDDTQPLYVNAKQYHRILKRRAARAKLESSGKVVRKRKVSDANHCSKTFEWFVQLLLVVGCWVYTDFVLFDCFLIFCWYS